VDRKKGFIFEEEKLLPYGFSPGEKGWNSLSHKPFRPSIGPEKE